MKALILAGGRGERLNQLTKNQNKCMIKVGSKRIIEYSFKNAIDSNVEEIIVVVGYRAEDIINEYGIYYKDRRIKYVFQREQLGMVHAIEISEEILDGADFLLLLGDLYATNARYNMMINFFYENKVFATCAVLPVKDLNQIKLTYSIAMNSDEKIYRLVEKPRVPFNNLMGTGEGVFRNNILNYIPQTPVNPQRKQKELTDLIQCAVDDGELAKPFVICDDYVNLNTPNDIEKLQKKLNQEEKTVIKNYD